MAITKIHFSFCLGLLQHGQPLVKAFPGLQGAAFSLRMHVAFPPRVRWEKGRDLSLLLPRPPVLLDWDLIHTTSFNFSYFLKAHL